jgi:hypothetical protein
MACADDEDIVVFWVNKHRVSGRRV